MLGFFFSQDNNYSPDNYDGICVEFQIIKWTASSEFGTYHLCEQQRFRRACAVSPSLHIRAVSPEPSLLAHKSSEPRGTFRQKARSLVPLNGWACAVKICHDGMLEDTNSLDGAQIEMKLSSFQNLVHLEQANFTCNK